MAVPGGLEIVIILVIALLLIGPGRIGKLSGELGKSVHNFRKGVSGEIEEEHDKKQ